VKSKSSPIKRWVDIILSAPDRCVKIKRSDQWRTGESINLDPKEIREFAATLVEMADELDER